MYTKKIYFSGGDFHELQAVFTGLPGVLSTRTGYLTGEGNDDEVHGIEVEYNPKKVDLSMLMDILFTVVTPYRPDGQGKAVGKAFRAGVWYTDAEDEPQLQFYMHFLASRGKPPAATGAGLTINDPNSKAVRKCYAKAAPLKDFRVAAEEHQQYFTKHPDAESFIDWRAFREQIRY
ncbi:MAG: peptide-methionine (S)-S-oxide reductase [Selenomonas sp.]|uniref:peptide-methionine (S)-S-oxide reductase n=1 Tax=Selenomonas sp. TaxID=2053611 RepID=UPI0025DC165B|nr:peptide-methionine (S)-S-oxide reductase [Selenomonas sp.]MCR5439831.1 peptide-methionine (S)-S-oxide reductase [Selenomonas sp.]